MKTLVVRLSALALFLALVLQFNPIDAQTSPDSMPSASPSTAIELSPASGVPSMSTIGSAAVTASTSSSLATSTVSIVTIAGVENGAKAPDFSLPDPDGKEYKLSDYAFKWVVLEWTNYDCPFVRKHYNSGAMQELQKMAVERGVVWLSINSSAPGKQGNFTNEVWKQRIAEQKVAATAVLLDSTGTVGRLYDAKTTPHLFLINPEGLVVYQGAIDSIRSTDAADIPKATPYVRQALEAALAGKNVPEPARTQPYGCSVKY